MSEVGLFPATPEFILDAWDFTIAFIKQYGWYFVFAFIAYLALREYVADRYYEYQDPRRKKDDETGIDAEEQERLRAVRERQQELHTQRAARAAEEKARIEAEKRAQKLEEFDKMTGNSPGHRLGDSRDTPTSKSPRSSRLRQNNNNMPLAGYGGSSGFRSSRGNGRSA